MRPTRAAGLALLAVLVAASADAKPKQPPPKAPPPPAVGEREGFWERVAHPNRKRYEELTAQGRQLHEQERSGAAVEVLAEAVRLEPQLPEAWYFLGMAYDRLDRWAECADALEVVDRLHPGGFLPEGVRAPVPQPQYTLALCAAAAGRYELATAQLEQALGQGKLDGNARLKLLVALGEVYMAQGRLEEAIVAYERAAEAVPQRTVAAVMFPLAVALDRDEQLGRSREVMIDAVTRLDPALATLSSPNNLYVPAEDEDYYRALALEVIATSDARKAACAPWTCRVLARAYFRRFVQRAPESLWRRRADAHLAELGGGAPVAAEVHVQAGDAKAVPAYTKVVVGAAGKLQACTGGAALALYVVDAYLPGKPVKAKPARPAPAKPAPKKPPPKHGPVDPFRRAPAPPPVPPGPPVPEFRVTSLTPGGGDETVRKCLQDAAAALPWPKPGAAAVRVVFAVAPP